MNTCMDWITLYSIYIIFFSIKTKFYKIQHVQWEKNNLLFFFIKSFIEESRGEKYKSICYVIMYNVGFMHLSDWFKKNKNLQKNVDFILIHQIPVGSFLFLTV